MYIITWWNVYRIRRKGSVIRKARKRRISSFEEAASYSWKNHHELWILDMRERFIFLRMYLALRNVERRAEVENLEF